MNVAQTDIASTLVTKPFKVTGISNALSRNEDDMVRDGSLLDSWTQTTMWSLMDSIVGTCIHLKIPLET